MAADICETSPKRLCTHEKEKKEENNATNKLSVGKQAQGKNGSYVRRQELDWVHSEFDLLGCSGVCQKPKNQANRKDASSWIQIDLK